MLVSVNPYTGEEWERFDLHTDHEVDAILSNVKLGFERWRKSKRSDRDALFRAIAALLDQRKFELANLMTREMGKPISQGLAEVTKCAWLCRHYAEVGGHYLHDEHISIDGQHSFVRHDPMGVVFGVMPWNYPFWQVFRFVIPALSAGNSTLLKHASNVTGCALAIMNVFKSAGAPDGIFNVLKMPGKAVGKIIEDHRIAAVTLTGSFAAGSSIAALAGKQVKPSLLELGGSNAFIVLEDADLDRAVDAFVQGRFQNTGQSCVASKRLMLVDSIADEFLSSLKDKMLSFTVGDPALTDTFIGPMAKSTLARELEAQMQRSLAQGAVLALGGGRAGAVFEPTLVTGAQPGMAVFDEETFGPLAVSMTVKGLDDAIALSNQSRFGLGVSIFSADTEALISKLSEFEEGAVFINDFVKSDPRLPFGGVKESGYGRELSIDGARSFVNRKTVVIKA